MLWTGIRAIRSGWKVPFYRIRHQRMAGGWRMVFIALLLSVAAFGLMQKGESVAYRYFPPSPTISQTPTITLTPTISLTPTITFTPTITLTPAISDTPTPLFVPAEIATSFKSIVTPNAEAVISPLEFSQFTANAQAVNPATLFYNPISHMYAVFTYDKMIPGVQWTAVWFRDGTQVYYETKPWDGTTGGYGFTDWNPAPAEWLPGTYTVAIFVGMDFKVAGHFTVRGDPPTPIPTATQTPTPTASKTPTITITPTITRTPRPTDTRWPTPTK
jgi:type VI secretion system secreted protein VgrG